MYNGLGPTFISLVSVWLLLLGGGVIASYAVKLGQGHSSGVWGAMWANDQFQDLACARHVLYHLGPHSDPLFISGYELGLFVD